MKNFFNISLILSLMVWFFTAFYLSIVFFVGIFIDVNPNISKTIFATSFLWAFGTIVVNRFIMKSTVQNVAQEVKKISNCKTCKKKN
jgi:hypothetical protein